MNPHSPERLKEIIKVSLHSLASRMESFVSLLNNEQGH